MASINKYFEETRADAVIMRDINNQITAFVRIFHPNYPKKNHSFTSLVGVGSFDKPRQIMQIFATYTAASTIKITLIDDDGNIYVDYFCN